MILKKIPNNYLFNKINLPKYRCFFTSILTKLPEVLLLNDYPIKYNKNITLHKQKHLLALTLPTFLHLYFYFDQSNLYDIFEKIIYVSPSPCTLSNIGEKTDTAKHPDAAYPSPDRISLGYECRFVNVIKKL
ncbi:hypothetical protein [Nostoc sp. NMS4]|uniref:hypothetical protein n=1 Tax=Nostoc sp. NMS4 TaxID=2815390 RepID=UPI0025EAC830|nr:hypothetical protein [Nostoc sp. NMS4]MBN3922166.1 hypothetical protein [Nostoc sp. NMS4]